MQEILFSLPDAYILAGGDSKRFPGDKALAMIDGQPQIVRLRDQLCSAGHRVHIVADRVDRYSAQGLMCIVDHQPHSGPLCGLITALNHQTKMRSNAWILVLGCDQLTWHRKWSVNQNTLAEFVELDGPARQSLVGSSGCKPNAVLWKSSILSPLPGYYCTDALLQLQTLWLSGQRSLRSMQSCLRLAMIEPPVEEAHPGSYSFNSPEQLAKLLSTN